MIKGTEGDRAVVLAIAQMAAAIYAARAQANAIARTTSPSEPFEPGELTYSACVGDAMQFVQLADASVQRLNNPQREKRSHVSRGSRGSRTSRGRPG